MVSLPTVGDSENTWGDKLNEFLLVDHTSDGKNKSLTNDGNAGATTIIEATQSGSSGSNVLIKNDGSATFTQYVSGVLKDVFKVAPGANPSVVIGKGASINWIDALGNNDKAISVDGSNNFVFTCPPSAGTIFTDGSGNILVIVHGGAMGVQLAPGVTFQAYDSPFAILGTILGLDGSDNTKIQAHPTGGKIVLLDSSGNAIAQFAGTNKITTLNGGQIVKRTAVSDANYTILASDYIIAYASLTTGRTATLPAAAAGNAGQEWIVKDEAGSAGTNNITVKTNGGTIDGVAGSTGKVISTNYGALRVYSNGTDYFTW